MGINGRSLILSEIISGKTEIKMIKINVTLNC